jgi:hypothetical protein
MRKYSLNCICLIFLLVTLPIPGVAQPPSQEISTDSTGIIGWRLGLVAGGTAVAFAVGHGFLNELWWKGEPVPFHVNTEQDYVYALGADKFGHAFFAFAAATVYADLMRWCGMDSTAAVWTGFGVAMTYQTYVEIRDGFSADYGFSWGDMAANTAGASFAVAKHYLPVLRPLDLQISFWPSPAYKSGAYGSIIDDYESTTHWLAVSPYDWLPTEWKNWYPPWLGMAVGHSVQNLDGLGGGNHTVTLSLDWDPARIRGLPPWLSGVLRVLHLYHLPAPAVQVYPNVVWYGLKF